MGWLTAPPARVVKHLPRDIDTSSLTPLPWIEATLAELKEQRERVLAPIRTYLDEAMERVA